MGARSRDQWVVLDLLHKDQVLATSLYSCIPGFEKVVKGMKGRFTMTNGREEEAEILEVCDQRTAKQIVEFMNGYIKRRAQRAVELENEAIDMANRPAGLATKFISSGRIDEYNERFDLIEQLLKDETEKNERFRTQMQEQFALYRIELDRIKALPGNEKLVGKKVPLFRFVERDIVDALFKQSGSDHSKFFPLAFYAMFSEKERQGGVRLLPQEKLLEFEQVLRFYYPQETPEADEELWKLYKKKMSRYASNHRRVRRKPQPNPSIASIQHLILDADDGPFDNSRDSSSSSMSPSREVGTSELIPSDILQSLIKHEPEF
ncbi:unnamed protein product [Bursaphelenchus xylophilus]|uniref:(pine wood nematode) hypothetical protein n=1 Tax=Bursaphelenchus xylophilus TaxID=6326 RepID=A0A1I7RX54_BURXY|nr:unnamed protein product [Bursaphelenchus xylophilus]CAG9121333.1 unnamed protein product [Bursaphelenchus xylophilus]